ncbi:MAG: putative TonB family protein [Pedosphaera sp.]|nr:putative TonB family protein [Pedosphaera sp.]
MNRLQKKCFIAVAATHSLLLGILLIGPAFLVRRDNKADSMPLLDVIPSKLIDEAMSSGGGSPAPHALPPPPIKEVQPPPTPAPEKPVEPVKVPVPEPVHKEPIKVVKVPDKNPDAMEKAAPPKPVKHPVQISTQLTRRTTSPAQKTPVPDATAEADNKQAQKLAKERLTALNNAMRNLHDGLSSSTDISMPGPGAEAYANYGQAVKSIYENAWAAGDVADDDGTTKATIIIRRDGTIISARVTHSSGSSMLDKSVESALLRVKSVPPFPEGAKDSERTFIINFNLKAKRLLG